MLAPLEQATLYSKKLEFRPSTKNFKNLRPPVPEELTLFNVFKKNLVMSDIIFLIFDKIILKILGIIKSH